MTQHKAIFKADEYSKRYYFSRGGGYGWNEVEPAIKTYNGKHLGNYIIWEGILDSPFLSNGEEVYVAELEKEVTITSSMRSTDGSVIYQTDYEFDLVEDEDTETSKLKAEKEKLEYEDWKAGDENGESNTTLEVKKSWFKQLFSR